MAETSTRPPRRARHRATRPPLSSTVRASLLWPLAALVVAGLVAARTLRGVPLPDDGALAGPAFLLTRGDAELDLLSPDGLGALHTAVYATVTRAFDRHGTLAGAERELLFVALLAAAVLLWRTGRRLGVPDAGCAVAVLVLGALPALAPLHAVAVPAQLAVGWLLLAGWLLAPSLAAADRPPPAAGAPAVVALVLAVLLAPDVLLLLVAGSTAAVVLRPGPAPRRVAMLVGGLLVLIGVRLLLPRWDPQPADPARWAADDTGALLLGAGLLLVGLLTAAAMPRARVAGVALAATTALAAAPPSVRLPALVVCLPVAAVLVGALAALATARVAERARAGRPRALLAAGLVAALLLAGSGVAAAAALAGSRPATDARAQAGLVTWIDTQLPDDVLLAAPPRVAAELVHAGLDAGRVRTERDAPVPASTAPADRVLRVADADLPDDAVALARFGGDRPLTVVDPRPAPPTPEQDAARRELAAALLANPTTEVPAADAERLAAGRVDPRLLTLLAGLAARSGIGLASLPAVPGEPADAAVRQAVISSLGGAPVADPATAELLRGWLAAQQSPFAPDRVTAVDGGLLVGYRLVAAPDDLLPPTGRG